MAYDWPASRETVLDGVTAQIVPVPGNVRAGDVEDQGR
jgi:hypothetical protein